MGENLFSRVLFEIDEITNYSCIRDYSKFKHEDEHLININIFLKITKIEKIINKNSNYYYIHLKFSKESELKSKKETQEYKKSLLKILDQNYQVDSFYMAEILYKLKNFN